MYVTATGGNAGAGANTHIALGSALGTCASMPAIVINELTTAAAAYAFGGLAPAAGSTAVSLNGNTTGLTNAYYVFTKLVSATTGAFVTGNETNATAVQTQLDTVANALAACVSSNGTTTQCAELTSCATAGATFVATGQACTVGTSTLTTDTLSAALSIVQNAGLVSATGITDVANSNASFSPALSTAPAEFSLQLIYSPGRVFGPLAIDSNGNVWVLSQNNGSTATPKPLSLVEVDPAGHLVSPANTGFTGGGISNIDSTDITNLAIDAQDNVWVGGSSDGIAELNAAGQGIPANGFVQSGGPSNTAGVAIDPTGNAWFADGNALAVFELNAQGTNLSGPTGFAASNCDCNGIAADSAGNMWIIDAGKNIAKMSSTGTQGPLIHPPGVAGGGAFFTAIAADTTGSYWVTDKEFHGVWQFNSVTGTFSANPFLNNAGGGTLPKGIAVDSAQHKWISNQQFNSSTLSSLTELSADGTTNLSPDLGFGTTSLTGGAHTVAVDQSGNVWVADGGVNVIQFVGAGAPTRNPIVSGITFGLAP
jgi:sugar lactone lactonase YvrE